MPPTRSGQLPAGLDHPDGRLRTLPPAPDPRPRGLLAVAIVLAVFAVASARPSRVAAAAPTPAAPVVISFGPPLRLPLRVVRPFQAPTTPYGPGHRGVDLAALAGTPVLAAAAGTVTFAGRLAGRDLVSVTHADGLRTTYEPLGTVKVRRGSVVVRGSPVGTLAAGHPGCSAVAPLVCLHWGALRGSAYLDPMSLLVTVEERLLTPVPGG